MAFFAPIPWEADAFYSQQVLIDKNITLDFYPVGTGPYRLVENNPHKQIVLVKNPNFHGEWYPSEGEPGDLKAGYLKAAEKPMPFINKIVFTLEKEIIRDGINFCRVTMINRELVPKVSIKRLRWIEKESRI